MKGISIFKIGIFTDIVCMTIASLIGNTNTVLVCGFSLIALLILDIHVILVKEIRTEKKQSNKRDTISNKSDDKRSKE